MKRTATPNPFLDRKRNERKRALDVGVFPLCKGRLEGIVEKLKSTI